MTTEPTNPAQGTNWGDPAPAAAPAKKGWTPKKTAIAAGIAVVIAAGGGVAIWAGTSSNSANAQQGQGPGGQGAGGPGFGGPGGNARGGGAFGAMNALRDALHGDFVVADPNGGSYTTERLQTGSVTAISATSVTLTSKDGYKQTYTIDSTTQQTGSPKTGDNVTVVAKVNGTTATATTLGEAGQFTPGQNGQRRGNRRPQNSQPPATN